MDGREEGGDVQSSITSSVTSSQLSRQVDNSQLLDDTDLREYRVGISILVMYSVFVGFLVSTQLSLACHTASDRKLGRRLGTRVLFLHCTGSTLHLACY